MADKIKIDLNDSEVRNLAPSNKRYTQWDAKLPGFGVRVTPTGHKSFVVLRQQGKGGKDVWETIGSFTGNNTHAARKKAENAASKLADGIKPMEERQRERGTSVEQALEQFLQSPHLRKLHSRKELEATLRRDVLGPWRTKRVTEIKRRDVTALLETIQRDPSRRRAGAEFSLHAARKGLKAGGSLFGWLASGHRCGVEVSPFAGISDKTIGVSSTDLERERVLDDDELRAIWHAAEQRGLYGVLLKILLLTGQRVTEWSKARWQDIKDDVLTIPPDRIKSKRLHRVYFGPYVAKLLADLKRSQIENSPWLFSLDGEVPLAASTWQKTELDKLTGITKPWKVHDLRRTARTRLGKLGVADGIAEKVLGHALPLLLRIYDRDEHEQERRAALTGLEKHILRVVGKAKLSTVRGNTVKHTHSNASVVNVTSPRDRRKRSNGSRRPVGDLPSASA